MGWVSDRGPLDRAAVKGVHISGRAQHNSSSIFLPAIRIKERIWDREKPFADRCHQGEHGRQMLRCFLQAERIYRRPAQTSELSPPRLEFAQARFGDPTAPPKIEISHRGLWSTSPLGDRWRRCRSPGSESRAETVRNAPIANLRSEVRPGSYTSQPSVEEQGQPRRL